MPPPMTNLVSWYDPTVGLYQDTGGTTPCTNGTSVALWKDQSGNGWDMKTSSGGNPVYQTGVLNGLPAVQFIHASNQYLATASSVTHGIGTGGFWLAMVVVMPSSIATSGPETTAFCNGSYAPAFYVPGVITPYKPRYYGISGSGDYATSVSANTAYLIEYGRVGSAVKMWIGTVGASPTLDANSVTDGGSIANAVQYLGWENYSTDTFNGYIAELLFYNTNLSSGNQSSLESYLNGKWGPVRPHAAPVVVPQLIYPLMFEE